MCAFITIKTRHRQPDTDSPAIKELASQPPGDKNRGAPKVPYISCCSCGLYLCAGSFMISWSARAPKGQPACACHNLRASDLGGALFTCEAVQVCVWVEVFNLLELDATAADDVLNGLVAFDNIGPVTARLHAVQYGSVLR